MYTYMNHNKSNKNLRMLISCGDTYSSSLCQTWYLGSLEAHIRTVEAGDMSEVQTLSPSYYYYYNYYYYYYYYYY